MKETSTSVYVVLAGTVLFVASAIGLFFVLSWIAALCVVCLAFSVVLLVIGADLHNSDNHLLMIDDIQFLLNWTRHAAVEINKVEKNQRK